MINRMKAHPIASIVFALLFLFFLASGTTADHPSSVLVDFGVIYLALLGGYLLLAWIVGTLRRRGSTNRLSPSRPLSTGAPPPAVVPAPKPTVAACPASGGPLRRTRRAIVVGLVVGLVGHLILGVCLLGVLGLGGASDRAVVVVGASWLVVLVTTLALAVGAWLRPPQRGWVRATVVLTTGLLPFAWIGGLLVTVIVISGTSSSAGGTPPCAATGASTPRAAIEPVAKVAPVMFRGDAARTGVMPGPGPGRRPVIRWAAQVGYSANGPMDSSPTVAGGVVYVAGNATLCALDTATGARRWRFTLGDVTNSSPAVADGLVYIGSNNHFLYAIDAQTGQLRWRFRTGDRVRSSPAVADGVVYVGSWDHFLYAIDAQTGQQRWRFRTGDTIDPSPAVAGGLVYIGSWDGNLYAVDGSTGQERWRFAAGRLVFATSVVVGGTVYVISRGAIGQPNVFALDAQTGQLRWAFAAGANGGWSSPAVDGGMAYVASDNTLFALDVQTGQLRWSDGIPGVIYSSPAVVKGAVYIGTMISLGNAHHRGVLYARGPAMGPEATGWNLTLGESANSSPAVVDGIIYIVGDDRLYAISGDPTR